MRQALFILCFSAIGLGCFAQIRKIPPAVTNAFSKQYPGAYDVAYKDNLLNVQVNFVLDSAKMMAKYNSDGEWKETDKASNYSDLPAAIKDGFQKSKYSTDWKVTETTIVFLPHNEIHYRLRVEKNEVQKKYLVFNKNGKLLRDALTI